MPTIDIPPGAGMEPIPAMVYGMLSAYRPRVAALLQDLTPGQLAQVPPGFNNSLAGLVVHVCQTEAIIAHAFLNRPLDDELTAALRGRPDEVLPRPTAETAASLTARLEASRALVAEGCAALRTADLERTIYWSAGRDVTMRWMLSLLITHQAQHFGQMQILRGHLSTAG